MKMGIIGRKVGMTQIFDEAGAVVPVTVVDASDCFITQVKTAKKEGYNALQVAMGNMKPQNVNKAEAGHFKKGNVQAKHLLREIRLEDAANVETLQPGARLSPNMFQKGDRVDVVGLSKGKGFQGVMRRHNYSGKDATHGTSKYFRHGGSNGTNTCPGKVLKNKGMPGQMGNARRTVQNIQVVAVYPEEGLILLKGAVQGFKGNPVFVRAAKKAKDPGDRTWTA